MALPKSGKAVDAEYPLIIYKKEKDG